MELSKRIGLFATRVFVIPIHIRVFSKNKKLSTVCKVTPLVSVKVRFSVQPILRVIV